MIGTPSRLSTNLPNDDLRLLEAGIITVPLESILVYWDPILDDAWGCGPIMTADVLEQVCATNQTSTSAVFGTEEFSSYTFNTSRIAYLIQNGWSDTEADPKPITVDVGMSGYTPQELVIDGNHRIAAAKLRGDEEIKISVMGDVDKALAIFCAGVYIDDY